MSTFEQIVRHKRGSHSDFYEPGTPINYPPDLELEPKHIEINLLINIPDEQASGKVTTTVLARGDSPRELELDAVDFEDDSPKVRRIMGATNSLKMVKAEVG